MINTTFDLSSFKKLPTDLQYKIFEFKGHDIPIQLLLCKSFPDLQAHYLSVEVKKAHNCFKNAHNTSPIKIAWLISNHIVKEIDHEKDDSLIKIVGRSLKILSSGIPLKKKKAIEDKWGLYSLNINRIYETEQMILDISLEKVWSIVSNELLTLDEIPTKAQSIRSWLKNPYNKRYIDCVEELYLNHLNLIVLPPEITHFRSLNKLYISHNRIKDISLLTNLTNLTVIHMNNNLIDDISPLQNLNNLTILILNNNKLIDINALRFLEKLTFLELNSNQINDIESLKFLKYINFISLNDNQLEDISPLKNLRFITRLSLKKNKISDISALKNHKELTILDLTNNRIRLADFLAELPLLKFLSIERNKINERELYYFLRLFQSKRRSLVFLV